MRAQDKQGKRHLSCRETSENYGMTQAYWRKKIANREIAVVRFDRAVRIPIEAIERFIAENTVPARER